MFLDDLDEEDYEIAIKVVIVGNGAVGKSSMIQRYCKGIFTKNYKKTIGVDFLEKHITASGEDVRLMLWDTAGQEEFDAITKAYYRGAQACVVAFSTVDRASFDAVKKWKRKVEDECGHIPMVLVQNKIDLLHESQVDNHEIEKFARNTGLKLFRTSVKENLNVSKVFQHLSERHIESVSRWSDEPEDSVFQIGGNGHQYQLGGGGGGGYNNSNNNQRDVRVRFSNSTENLESSSGGSSSDNSLSYFRARRLFPLGQQQLKNNNNNKRGKKQQQQQQILFHPATQFPFSPESSNKTIILNPFRRGGGGGQRRNNATPHLYLHQGCFPPPLLQQQPASKPACRVL